MALSDDQIVNIWGREPRYHAAPVGSTDIAFARDIEAEVRKQDNSLILQLVEALEESAPHTDRKYRWKPEDWMRHRAEAITAGRARLEGKPCA